MTCNRAPDHAAPLASQLGPLNKYLLQAMGQLRQAERSLCSLLDAALEEGRALEG